MSAAKMLADRQVAALGKLEAAHYRDARYLGAHTATLASLVVLGLASSKWSWSSIKGGERKVYRLTGAGIVARRNLERAGVLTSANGSR